MRLFEQPAFQHITGKQWRPGGLKLTGRGVELCAWPPGALLADVGCGRGGTSEFLRQRGYRVFSVDRYPLLADGMTEGAGGTEGAGMTEGMGILADAGVLPFASGALDGLVCECVLSLVAEPAAVLLEFARVLKPGARALISDLTVNGQASARQTCTDRPCTDRPCTDRPCTDRSCTDRPCTDRSCTDGALHLEDMEHWLRHCGLIPLVVEDHRDALRELAAQLAWHGIPCTGTDGTGGKGGNTGGHSGGRALGYHLWIVRKETL